MLIGTSGVGKTFTKEVVEAMATVNEVLFPSFRSGFSVSKFLFLMLIFMWWVTETLDSCSLKPNFSSRVHGRRSLQMDQGNDLKLIDTNFIPQKYRISFDGAKKMLVFDYRVVQYLQVEALLTLLSIMAKHSRLARFVFFSQL